MPRDIQTTGAVCTLGCDGGFRREGSGNRVCLGDSWTGLRTVCDPYECDRLEAPTNGALVFPCDRDYGTSCTVICTFGYMLQGPSQQSCVLVGRSRTEVEWTDPPACIGMYACIIHCQYSQNFSQDKNFAKPSLAFRKLTISQFTNVVKVTTG